MMLCLRVKRKKETWFLKVRPTDSTRKIKKLLGALSGEDWNKIRLLGDDKEKVLEDDATVGDNQLQDGAVIFAVFATNDAGTAFEAVEVDDGAAPAAAEAGNA